jgi:hypothetical protein
MTAHKTVGESTAFPNVTSSIIASLIFNFPQGAVFHPLSRQRLFNTV